MIVPDVNVLVYAFRKDVDRHPEYRRWLLRILNGDTPFGVSEHVLASTLRVVTHPRICRNPSTLQEALILVRALVDHPLCRLVRPRERHWSLFVRMCQQVGAKANLISNAWFAALALESGCVWVTTDRDFSRFPGLEWMHPLDHETGVRNPG